MTLSNTQSLRGILGSRCSGWRLRREGRSNDLTALDACKGEGSTHDLLHTPRPKHRTYLEVTAQRPIVGKTCHRGNATMAGGPVEICMVEAITVQSVATRRRRRVCDVGQVFLKLLSAHVYPTEGSSCSLAPRTFVRRYPLEESHDGPKHTRVRVGYSYERRYMSGTLLRCDPVFVGGA